MEIKRSDATKISEKHRSYLLDELKVTSKDLLAVGTEAEVYSYGESQVLKLYADSSRLVTLKTLEAFYDSLDDTPSGLKLPRIVTIKESGPPSPTLSLRDRANRVISSIYQRVHAARGL
jgi:hypothetical protein